MKAFNRATASKAVLKVGDGRGFVVKYRKEHPPFKGEPASDTPLVITAAHCLPRLPRNMFDYGPYENVLGRLDCKKPDVWADCLFVDPVADIAILCEPDSSKVPEEQFDAYSEVVGD